jgi:hypothetical protein
MKFRILTREEYIEVYQGHGCYENEWKTVYYPQVQWLWIWWDIGSTHIEKEAIDTIDRYKNRKISNPYKIYKTHEDLM